MKLRIACKSSLQTCRLALIRLFTLFMIIMAGPLAAETQQHRWVGDVPIMNGLIIEPELGFAFDSPNGRIVMIFGSSDTTPSEIIQFYGKALAQLGWKGGAGSWVRGGERLIIGEVETARGTLWRLMLQPES